jgi:three-Cys-motif partner protein
MRKWSPHTEEKISILADYLRVFAQAARSAPNRVYVDAFAGDTMNVLKTTGEQFPGSVESALAVEPPFTQLLLFEKDRRRAESLRSLATAHPSSKTVVVEGDCNQNMVKALADVPPQAPVFAFLDPDGMELQWRTIKLLSDHKRRASKTKVEMWVLLPTAGLVRMLGSNRAQAEHQGLPEKVARLYGAWGPWETVWKARLDGTITPGEAKRAYLLLYMDRLADLGYKHLLARPIKNSRNELYVMVFATDHPAGAGIMKWAQEKDRVVHRAPSLFDIPEARPPYEDIHTGWRDDLDIDLSDWVEYRW